MDRVVFECVTGMQASSRVNNHTAAALDSVLYWDWPVSRSGALVSAGPFCQGFTFSNEGYLYFRSDCKPWPDPWVMGLANMEWYGHAIKIRDDDPERGGREGWPARLDFTTDRISLCSPSASSLNFRKRIVATCLFYCYLLRFPLPVVSCPITVVSCDQVMLPYQY